MFTLSYEGRMNELTTGVYTGSLVDDTGAAIGAASLVTLTLTLYDAITKTYINARNAQNILNANNVTVDSSGNLIWSVQALDNLIVNDTLSTELHVALFQWTYGAGAAKSGKHAVGIRVVNFETAQ